MDPREKLAEHAAAIGHVIINQSWMMAAVDSLLINLTPLEPGAASSSVLANMDERRRIELLLAVGLRCKVDDA